MPKKKPLQEMEEVGRKVAAYIRARLAAECEEDRGRAAVISRETGLTPSMVSQVRRGHSPAGPKFAGAIARYWGMTIDQLEAVATGQQDAPPAPEPPEPTPQTPPAKSDVRAKHEADHWFPDEVEELYARAIKIKAEVDYSAPVGRVAKVFVRDATHQLKKGVTRLDLMLIALDTARAIEASGGELTPGAIYGAMISEAIEQARPRTGESNLERLLREADEKNQREGIVADLPGWIPAPPAELPPEIPAHTPRLHLPPLPPAPPPSSTSPVSAPPPPASGPVRKGKSRGRR